MKMMPFLLNILSLYSCQKEMVPSIPSPPPPDTITTKLKVLWQVPISVDTSEYSTSPEAIFNGNILFSTNFASPSAYVQMRDGETGTFLWKFDGFHVPIDGFVEYQVFGIELERVHIFPATNRV